MPTPSRPADRERRRSTRAVATPATSVARLLAVLALAGLHGLAGAGAAGAHSILVSATPGPGDHLDALTEVRLDFSGDLAADRHVVTVHGPGGVAIAATRYELPQPNTLVAHFDAPVPPGEHEIVWEAVAGDGHHEIGRIPVTVTPPTAPTTAQAVSESQTGAPADVASAPRTGGAADDRPVWAMALVAVVVAVVATVLAHRRRAGSADR